MHFYCHIYTPASTEQTCKTHTPMPTPLDLIIIYTLIQRVDNPTYQTHTANIRIKKYFADIL